MDKIDLTKLTAEELYELRADINSRIFSLVREDEEAKAQEFRKTLEIGGIYCVKNYYFYNDNTVYTVKKINGFEPKEGKPHIQYTYYYITSKPDKLSITAQEIDVPIEAISGLPIFRNRITKNAEAIFSEIENSLVGLLPIPYGTPDGTFNFTIACGVTKKTFTVNIGVPDEQTDIVTDAQNSSISKTFSANATNEVIKLLEDISAKSRPSLLSSNSFNALPNDDLSIAYSFSDKFTVTSQFQSNAYALGCFYESISPRANEIFALNSGIVTHTGSSQRLGNIVVVDHGMGLCTWYCNLGDIDVRTGDVLAKGELIGKAGNSPLVSKNGTLIICSVYNVFVDPELILGKEIF
jgi:hypothetical protein